MVLVSLHYTSSTENIFLSTWVNSLGCSLYAGAAYMGVNMAFFSKHEHCDNSKMKKVTLTSLLRKRQHQTNQSFLSKLFHCLNAFDE